MARAGYFGFVLRSYSHWPTTGEIDAAQLGRRPGEGPAIEKVHYFGFVLPNLGLRSYSRWAMRWWDGRARVMAAAVHDLCSAISRTRDQNDFGEGRGGPPLETFIILASFCQI